MSEIIDSPFLWSGKKTNLLPQLLPLFPKQCDLFVDLFGGSGSVIVNTTYNHSLYNDLYMGDIIKEIYHTTYKDIVDHCNNRIKEFDLSKENKEGYYKFKDLILSESDMHIKNLDLFCLSLFAFNGSLEFNLSGEVTSSFGKRNRFNVVQAILKEFKDNLYNANIINNGITKCDYKDIINKIINISNKDIFVYADVPYSITRINGYKSDYKDNEFFKYLDLLTSKGIKWGMSNVFEHKGVKNNILIEFAKKYNIHYLDYDYNNLNNTVSLEKEKVETNKTIEVYICNY